MASPSVWVACLAAALVGCCCGSYVITLPREWVSGGVTQVCTYVDNTAAPPGSLTLSASYIRYYYNNRKRNHEVEVVLPNVTIEVPGGEVQTCTEVQIPKIDRYRVQLWLRGRIDGSFLNRTLNIRVNNQHAETHIQTDKYLYKPSQTVHWRILTLDRSNLTVHTTPYREVYVTTPSRNRIAQWRDVDNSQGLVHLAITLADEPEEGRYRISVVRQDNSTSSQHFLVEEYVLPRFEVTLTPPSLVMATDSFFSFKVCGKYTFGQPVQGNVTLEVNNNGYRGCRKTFNLTKELSGCADFVVDSADVRMLDCSVGSVAAHAWVEEAGTGVVLEGDSSVRISKTTVSFNELYKDNYIKKGLPYTLKVKAERPDKSPAAGVQVEMCAAERCYNFTIAQDGVIKTMVTRDTKTIRMKALITRAPLYESSFSTTLEPYYSPSNSSLLIYVPEETLKCVPGGADLEYTLPVFFVSDQPRATINVQIVSRRHIQYWSSEQYVLKPGALDIPPEDLLEPLPTPPPGTNRGVVKIPITLPHSASPTARVLVWMVRPDGEVVSDTREVKVEKCLANIAELQWSQPTVEPGQEAQLSLTSAPLSFCSLGVVDRSSQLLNPLGDTLTLEKIFQPLYHARVASWGGALFNNHDYCRNLLAKDEFDNAIFYSKYVDALKMFDDAGVFVLSDLKVETRPCERQEYSHRRKYHSFSSGIGDGAGLIGTRVSSDDRVMFQAAPMDVEIESTSNEGPGEDATRTDFPETWLWDLHFIPESGILHRRLTLPDTITQWVGKAVCVHPEAGVGLSKSTNITTFTPFFLDLTLPSSMKRGEVLAVPISIFNYLDHPLPVVVEVNESPEYVVIGDPSSQAPAGQLHACVPSQSKVVLQVKVKPFALGEVNITVGAAVDRGQRECGTSATKASTAKVNRRDRLVKPITVKPEGFLREDTWNKYICIKDLQDGSDSLGKWEVAAPTSIVEGSDRGWVTVVGDLLTLTLENLGHLIRMPYGCGEQNMLNFAPNIFILQFLNATKQANEEATTKLKQYMTTGYQRQLLYRRSNGSYSAFGSADASGSTWLTAFVVKSFAQAQPFITIDRDGLNASRNWLKSTQREDGCFTSIGKVFNKAMKGGVDNSQSPVPLSAYVLVSLLEAGEKPGTSLVLNATSCLVGHTTPAHDAYTLALKAYALALAEAEGAVEVLELLLAQAVDAPNSTHWELPKGPWRSNSLAVETAGYAVLAMMAINPKGYDQQARKVVKWIISQRNGQGGFYSTQDTVVALQAMAKYESYQFQGELDLVATIKGIGIDHSFALDENNKLVTQRASLSTLPTNLHLTMVGQGCAVFQSVLRYNVHKPNPSEAFSLTAGARTSPDKTCTTKSISTCASYLLPDGKSNMAVLEVELVTGYIPIKDDLKAAVRDNPQVVKRYEVDGSKVFFYIEEFTAGEEVCVTFRATRIVDVEEAKPGSISVYDYYRPEFSFSKTYTMPANDECIYAW